MPTIKVQIECESVEEFIEIFGPLVSNTQTVVEATVIPASQPVTEPKPDSEPKPEPAKQEKKKASAWTPEKRKAQSERMKKIRAERHWSTKTKKAQETKEETKEKSKEKPKESKKKTKGKKRKKSTSGWTAEKRKAAGDRMRARMAKKKAEKEKAAQKEQKESEKTKPKGRKGRNLAWTERPTGKKGKKEKKQSEPEPTKEQPKTRPVNDMFTLAYDAMATAIASTSMADTNSILETMSVTEAEQEMATEIVMKLMRAAAGHAKNEFSIGEGDNPTLLCFSAGATLPSLDILRAY